MSKHFSLLVFDWDGTLMDSAEVIAACIQAACMDLKLPVPETQQAKHVIGLGLNEALTTLLPALNTQQYDQLVERYRFHYLSEDSRIPLFDGAVEAIASLHQQGFLLAVATGKSQKGLQRALCATGLKDYFHATRCADQCFSKPHPQMLYELMTELDRGPQQTLMIGDTSHDLQMAKNAGVSYLAAAYGAHSRDSLLQFSPLICADNFAELHQWLTINA